LSRDEYQSATQFIRNLKNNYEIILKNLKYLYTSRENFKNDLKNMVSLSHEQMKIIVNRRTQFLNITSLMRLRLNVGKIVEAYSADTM